MISNNGWQGGFVEWTGDQVAYLSVVFSWQLQEAYQRAIWYRSLGYYVRVGGPAVAANPEFFAGVAIQLDSGSTKALFHHNPSATFTSRGCPNRCKFCIVPKIEGGLCELEDWEVKSIVCDNNLLACSLVHFNNVIDRLMPIRGVDFNQGLDARLLTKHHAERLAELDTLCIRLAWDNTQLEKQFLSAYQLLHDAGFAPQHIRVYVLIGYQDTPEDALYRLQTVKALGSWPNPMRYQPLDAKIRNEYVAPEWTDRELKRYCRYWSRQAWLEHIPFEEYQG